MNTPVDTARPGEDPLASRISKPRRRFFLVWAGLFVIWAAVMVAIASAMPDLYYYSYYSVDYSLGFIRRGLAGELPDVIPGGYFSDLRILRWAPTVVYTLAMATVALVAARRFGASERRLMLALSVPILPFGFAFALFSARPDLIGAAALALFAAFLAAEPRSARTVVIASSVYGAASVPLTLVHEATPFLYALGAVAVTATFARHCSPHVQRWSSALAVAPGALAGLAVALLGLRGVSAELCALTPRGSLNNPFAGRPDFAELLRGFRHTVDYRDWTCQYIFPYFDQGFGDALRFVAGRGVLPLLSSLIFGIFVFWVTMVAISNVSGVPLARFTQLLRRRAAWVLASLAMLTPVFLTGVDWTRWLVVISYDIGLAYLLYASSQPESALPATRRNLRVFVTGTTLLAIFPIGLIPGFAGVIPW